MKTCPKCGYGNTDNSKFCVRCGCCLNPGAYIPNQTPPPQYQQNQTTPQKNTSFKGHNKGIFDKIKEIFGTQKYDLTTIEGIRAIPIPTKKKKYQAHDIRNDIEYILQRKATEYKRAGRMDLAIECLRKSNEIMPYSAYMYTAGDYYRLVDFLKQARRFDEARAEKAKLDLMLSANGLRNEDAEVIRKTPQQLAREFGTDLVEMDEHPCTCGECAKYQGRVFSLSGRSTKFPKIPDEFFIYGGIHEGCSHSFFPYFDGVSKPTYHRNIVAYSNRPFVDNRTKAQKLEYEQAIKAAAEEAKDRENYEWCWEYLGDIAPKSFSGYRRMKNSDSANFQKLCQAALEKGRDIR